MRKLASTELCFAKKTGYSILSQKTHHKYSMSEQARASFHTHVTNDFQVSYLSHNTARTVAYIMAHE